MTTVKQGRPPKGLSFTNAGRARASVYLAGMSNGFVKVGFSDNPRTRLSSFNNYAKRKYGASIVCFHVYEGIGTQVRVPKAHRKHSNQARALEARLIGLLAGYGRACAPSSEVFEGICYDAAKDLVDAEIAKLKQTAA